MSLSQQVDELRATMSEIEMENGVAESTLAAFESKVVETRKSVMTMDWTDDNVLAVLKLVRMDLKRAIKWNDGKDYEAIATAVQQNLRVIKETVRVCARQAKASSKSIQKRKAAAPRPPVDPSVSKRPRGAAPRGYEWDYVNGVWKKNPEASQVSSPALAPLNVSDASASPPAPAAIVARETD